MNRICWQRGVMHRLLIGSQAAALLWLMAVPAVVAAPPEPWAFWSPGDAAVTNRIDHSLWQEFLGKAVILDDQAQMNLVRYRQLSSTDRILLDDYLRAMQAIDPRGYSQAEQMAFWINLYNAVTVQVVLDHPDEHSIRDMGAGFFSRGPWSDELINVAGKELTLDDIEHRILRPLWKDRRIHFALNCASIGCPELAAAAYTAKNLDAMLAAAEVNYINSSRGVLFAGDSDLVVSSIFDWYAEDFAPDEEALLAYLARNSEPLTRERLLEYRGPIRYQYDWSLNSSD